MLAFAKALHHRGVPSHRLEAVIDGLARRLGCQALVLAAPTSVQIAFERKDRQRVHLLRGEPGEVDLGKICELNDLIDAVSRDRLPLSDAVTRLAEIERLGSSFGPSATVVAFAAASSSAACFFGSTHTEIAASGLLGLLVGGLALLARRRAAFGRVFEVAAALVAMVLAAGTAVFAPVSVDRVALSAVIALVPGFTLTVAMSELAERHLASGVARLAGAVTTFLAIGLGVGLGVRIGAWLPAVGAPPPAVHPTLPALATALVLAALAFAILFQARIRDVPWLILGGAISFSAARVGGAFLGAELGTFAGALAIGVYGNTLSRLRSLPTAVVQVPGIMLLVPGSLGYRAVSMLLVRDVVSGVEAAFSMFLVAISLVGGLLFANAIMPARRDL